jgi:hypothetical protein
MANTNTDDIIMAALQYILPGQPYNTRLAQVGGPIYIQQEYSLSLGKFPALHLEAGRQKHSIQGNNVYDADMQFLVTYFDRWDQSTISIDQIRATINADLQIMMTNVQKNSSLTVGNVSHATAVYAYELSPYKGELDDKIVPGYTIVKRALTLSVSVLPYDVF